MTVSKCDPGIIGVRSARSFVKHRVHTEEVPTGRQPPFAILKTGDADSGVVHEPRGVFDSRERELIPPPTFERLHPARWLWRVILNQEQRFNLLVAGEDSHQLGCGLRQGLHIDGDAHLSRVRAQREQCTVFASGGRVNRWSHVPHEPMQGCVIRDIESHGSVIARAPDNATLIAAGGAVVGSERGNPRSGSPSKLLERVYTPAQIGRCRHCRRVDASSR